jgi:hypothetical protein
VSATAASDTENGSSSSFMPSYSNASYYTTLALYVASFPGLWSQIKRSTTAKVKRKTYVRWVWGRRLSIVYPFFTSDGDLIFHLPRQLSFTTVLEKPPREEKNWGNRQERLWPVSTHNFETIRCM